MSPLGVKKVVVSLRVQKFVVVIFCQDINFTDYYTMKGKIQNTGKTQIPSLIRYTAGLKGSASDVLV